MNETADVVVIGGGVNGTSAAFNLAKLGVKNIILLEHGELSSGATGKSGALVRMHYTNPYESKLAFESLKIFQSWSDVVGGDCGWENPGFVQLVAPGYEHLLEENVQDQQKIGITTEVISIDDLRELVPGMYVDDVGAAAYEAESGWADPNATTYSFAKAAEALGVEIRTNCPATAIITSDDRVVGVETAEGRIATDHVIVAAGVGAADLLIPLGLDFDLVPHRSTVVVFRWPAGFDGPFPVVIDTINDAWMRPEGIKSTLIGTEAFANKGNPFELDETVIHDYVDMGRRNLSARFPAFKNAIMRGGWAGMYTMSPDTRPIIDQILSVDGLYVMIGDSGHCFKTAPAVGQCLAEWVVHGEPQLADLSYFSAARFEAGGHGNYENYGRKRRTISR